MFAVRGVPYRSRPRRRPRRRPRPRRFGDALGHGSDYAIRAPERRFSGWGYVGQVGARFGLGASLGNSTRMTFAKYPGSFGSLAPPSPGPGELL